MGMVTAFSGDWDHGIALVERAKGLNPHHAGWYHFPSFYNAYRKGEYRAAIGFAYKIKTLNGYWMTFAARAAAHGQLGEQEAAEKALKDLRALRPDFGSKARVEFAKLFDPELVERIADGLRKAGLDITLVPSPAALNIAVFPFTDLSPSKDQEFLCEGMAEEIMNALVPIEGIRVAARNSAFRARHDNGDLAAAARTLSVGHVIEGSIRTSPGRIRVTAQLTEIASGYQLWSQRFDRETADLFAVQDEIAAGIVEAVKERFSLGEFAARSRHKPGSIEAYRAYLKGQHARLANEDIPGAIAAFEESIRLDPTHAPSLLGLAEATVLAAFWAMAPARETYKKAHQAVATSIKLQGESADSCHVSALVAYCERDWGAFERSMRRAIQIEPRHVRALASFGAQLCFLR